MSQQLPELHYDPVLDELPPLNPQFFVSRLVDRPQNPIMDSLRLSQDLKQPSSFLTEDRILTAKLFASNLPKLPQDIWAALSDKKALSKTNLHSWNTFHPSYPSDISPSPYLSEQNSIVFAAARHHVRPLLSDATTEVLYIDQQDLLPSLWLLVTGTSSVLHSWDPASECFSLRGTAHGNRGLIVVVGKDEVITSSFISRFLTIGNISRRLEILTNRVTDNDAGPTMHAFAHSLSSVLIIVRVMLMESNCAPESDVTALSSFWMNCEEAEQILTAVAKLCHREEEILPINYPAFPSAMKLLSEVYNHCASHFEKSSPRIVTAVFAFILTTMSRDYFQQIRSSLGFGTLPVVAQELSTSSGPISFNEGNNIDSSKVPKQEHPCFVSPELQRSVRNAQKSLRVLQAACPNHPLLLESARNLALLGWFWTTQEIKDAWDRREINHREEETHNAPRLPPRPNGPMYKAELADLQIFDRDLATNLHNTPQVAQIRKFITDFPAFLPALTPTVEILTSLVLSPLAEHAATLSGALLNVFTSGSISESYRVDLNLHSHLTLLRSFLLLTSHLFKSKLSAALFSDSDQYLWGSQSRDARSLTLTSQPPTGLEKQKPWPVGLAPGLIERESWPPGGADLSFYLRTVILDSTDVRIRWRSGDCPSTAFEEADSRLGFAIRDLPTGKGRDKWLDPCSIEALDFLYMEYHPPDPLRILIAPDILSKYQRVFAFNLRLIRVENAVRALYRFSRSKNTPLFPTFTPTNRLFLHFRFLIQIFVTQFSSYTYDTAIRGHFDAFLHMLKVKNLQQFPDIFSLAEYHSRVMDDVLTACLLRSGQRTAGDVLRTCLETILELGVLAGELIRGRVQEYEAKPMLEGLYQKFKEKVAQLIQVLKLLTEKEIVDDTGNSEVRRGGVHSIHHLLVKLDSVWW